MSNFQTSVDDAGKILAEAYANKKSVSNSVKDMKKSLKEELESNSQFNELSCREKELNKIRAEMLEELQEIKKAKEQIIMESDIQKEIDDFLDDIEEKFQAKKEFAMQVIADGLKENNMTAEIQYKNGKILLLVISL